MIKLIDEVLDAAHKKVYEDEALEKKQVIKNDNVPGQDSKPRAYTIVCENAEIR
jgi:hypothetical protein